LIQGPGKAHLRPRNFPGAFGNFCDPSVKISCAEGRTGSRFSHITLGFLWSLHANQPGRCQRTHGSGARCDHWVMRPLPSAARRLPASS